MLKEPMFISPRTFRGYEQYKTDCARAGGWNDAMAFIFAEELETERTRTIREKFFVVENQSTIGKEQTMSDRKRCCCNCRRCIRTWDGSNCTTHCEIDGHYIGYVECFEDWCRHWAKDKWQEGADDE